MSLVLAVSVIISALVGFMLLLTYHQVLILSRNSQIENAQRNALSGISFLLGSEENTIKDLELDLFGDRNDSVYLEKKSWGLLEVISSRAMYGKHEEIKVALIGADMDTLRGIALHLVDEDRPIFIADSVIIEGRCFLPKAGVKNVSMHQTKGEVRGIIRGPVLKSNSKLPENVKWVLAKSFDNVHLNMNNPLFKMESLSNKTIIDNSFMNESKLVQSDFFLRLDGITISGKVIVASREGIAISKNAQLQDVIIIAPYITIEEGFTGSLQLFATDSIIVSKNCYLGYPSVIALNSKNANGIIQIGENSEVTGEVIAGGTGENGSYNLVSIQPNALINGVIYVDGAVDHKGKLNGSLISRRLKMQTPSGMYDNYIRNASIDAKSLSKFFLVSPVSSPAGKKGIIKWLK